MGKLRERMYARGQGWGIVRERVLGIVQGRRFVLGRGSGTGMVAGGWGMAWEKSDLEPEWGMGFVQEPKSVQVSRWGRGRHQERMSFRVLGWGTVLGLVLGTAQERRSVQGRGSGMGMVLGV